MKNERLLNGFLTRNLGLMGLVHIKSEVSTNGGRQDILAYDPELNVPIVLELKNVKNKDVISQLQDYISRIENNDPGKFNLLASFGKTKFIRFNQNYGLVGIVVSPDHPPIDPIEGNSSIIWAQFDNENNVFSFPTIKLLTKKKAFNKDYTSEEYPDIKYPHDILQSIASQSLKTFADLLHVSYVKHLPTLYVGPKNKYVAYYSGETLDKAIGGYTRNKSKTLSIDFHVKKPNHDSFIDSDAVKSISALGLELKPPGKGFIFSIHIKPDDIETEEKRKHLLSIFVEIQKVAFDLARDKSLDAIIFDDRVKNILSLRQYLFYP